MKVGTERSKIWNLQWNVLKVCEKAWETNYINLENNGSPNLSVDRMQMIVAFNKKVSG